MPGEAVAATPNAAEVAAIAPVERTPEQAQAAKAVFVQQLKAENASGDDAAVVPVVDVAKPAAKAASSDVEAIRLAYKDGDVEKLAELLGENPVDAKITKSKWAEHRIATRQAKREIAEQRQAVQGERQQLEAERQRIVQSASVLGKAQQHLANEDYVAFLEIATGKNIDQILETMTTDAIDPSKREARQLRKQLEQDRAERETTKQAEARQLAEQQRSQNIAKYQADLKTTLTADEAYAPWVEEFGEEFVRSVFDVLGEHFDGENTIAPTRAAKILIGRLEKRYQSFAKLLGGETIQQSSSKDSKTAVKGSGSARLAPRKSVTSNQGGTSPAKELSKQEKIAYFARQLKAENAG